MRWPCGKHVAHFIPVCVTALFSASDHSVSQYVMIWRLGKTHWSTPPHLPPPPPPCSMCWGQLSILTYGSTGYRSGWNVIITTRDLRFSQWFCWRATTSGMTVSLGLQFLRFWRLDVPSKCCELHTQWQSITYHKTVTITTTEPHTKVSCMERMT